MLIVAVLTGVVLVGVAWVAGEATKLEPTLQPAKAPARSRGRK
jgi:hypothetical protein